MLLLLLSFLKIGLFAFGGGYAMVGLIQGEVVTSHGWLTSGQFTDIVAISQMTPGPVGINMATYVGYTAITAQGGNVWLGILGSLIATTAVMLPSFVIMTTVARYLLRHQNDPTIVAIFRILRPAIVGLIAAAVLLMLTTDNFGDPTVSPWQFGISVLLYLGALLAIRRHQFSPITVLLASALIGILLL